MNLEEGNQLPQDSFLSFLLEKGKVLNHILGKSKMFYHCLVIENSFTTLLSINSYRFLRSFRRVIGILISFRLGKDLWVPDQLFLFLFHDCYKMMFRQFKRNPGSSPFHHTFLFVYWKIKFIFSQV